ncbi:acyl-CoA dehydrogenase family protein [Rhodococcus sp. X156]|uniref:acyl-CoA dehydrogenase family protein n=1 Tax=Rhodococcus sp. X156 TaxID=2499145 RepID=UPI000FDC2807|nr:acyl-CoA dehydrogenase family protein [Rhodococcus sp. X156]
MSSPVTDSPGIDTEEQAGLRASVRDLLSKHSDSAAVRTAIQAEQRHDTALWERLCQQVGVAALAVPEAYDGVGATFMECHVVQEELGRRLAPTPMLGSAVLAVQALLLSGDDAACARLLPGIASGESTVAVCWASAAGWDTPGVAVRDGVLHGSAHYVLDGEHADVLLVLATDGAAVSLHEVAADADGVRRTARPSMDPTRGLSTVDFDGVAATRLSAPEDLAEKLRTVAVVAVSAEQVGGAQAVLDLTVAYTKDRRQFGRQIGSFQALKHRMADMYVLVESARSISYAAADAVSRGTADAAELAATAKVYCSEAFSTVAGEAIQLHGGIGITWEHDAQLYFKRAHGTAQLFGQPSEHLLRLESMAGL